MKRIIIAVIAMAMTIPSLALEQKSPNGNVVLNFELNGQGTPVYSLTYKGQVVIKPSTLGLEIVSRQGDLMEGFEVTGSETGTFDETWQPVWGETRDIRNHYNELLVKMVQNKSGSEMNLRFRVYDEGIGLRYEFPR